MKDGRKLEYPEQNPDNEFQKMSNTKARKLRPQPKLEPTLWQARKAYVLAITPRVVPMCSTLFHQHPSEYIERLVQTF